MSASKASLTRVRAALPAASVPLDLHGVWVAHSDYAARITPFHRANGCDNCEQFPSPHRMLKIRALWRCGAKTCGLDSSTLFTVTYRCPVHVVWLLITLVFVIALVACTARCTDDPVQRVELPI